MNSRKPIRQLVVLVCFAIVAQAAYAQQKEAAADKYVLGSRTVRIPAPEGFIDVVPRFDRITSRFVATESPDNEVLAVHVPRTLVPRLEKGEEPALDFYTKVSVSRRLKTVEATPEMFAEVVKVFQESSDTLLDPKGPVLTSVMKNAEKGLNEHWGEDTGLKISEPKNLG